MEENEDKKPEVNEPEAPEAEPEKPVESGSEAPKKEGGKLDAIKGKAKAVKDKAKEKAKVVKQKTGEFMGVKRNRIIVLACSGAAIVALVVGLSVGLTQCHGNGGDNTSSSNSESKGGEGGSSSSHTHEYGTAWKSDATQHWHECSCGEKSGNAAHTFGTEIEIIEEATESKAGRKGYKCSVCGYAKDTFEYNPYISAETFEDAFKFTESKFAIDCAFTKGENNAWDGESLMARDGDLARSYNKWTSDDGTVKDLDNYYSREESEGSYTYYAYSLNDGAWTKKEDSEDKFFNKYFNPLDFRGLLFTNLTYSSLTFDSNSESYKGQCTRGSATFDVEVFFNNGRFTKFITKADDKTSTYTVRTTPYDLTTPHVHALNDGYAKDATGHWKSCSKCDEKVNFAAHTFKNTLNLNSPNKSVGYNCTTCGYQNTSDYTSGTSINSVLYGYYPQTHVSDQTTIDSLNNLSGAESNGWYLLNGTYYAKVAEASPYGDTYYFSDGAQINVDGCYWFKVEPIEWKITSSSGDDQYSLFSSLVLDKHQFHSNTTTNVYKNSDLRTWLTGTFYNTVFSNGGSYLQAYTSGGLNDKVYLLDNNGYINYGVQCKVSDYAKAIGARLADGTDYGEYWTSTQSPQGGKAAKVSGDGYHHNYVDTTLKYGVRPVITVKIS